ncbi:hypothetical protein [Streptomyces sp. NPDC047071]|uniref:hypothetical protein n=1 Tax=Streptomyces sp. NPDC047071 TaxID=3154808 RepID=UPI003454E1D6
MTSAGDNPDRLHSEASFAQLCGAAPVAALPRPHQTPPRQPRRRPRSGQRPAHHRAGPHEVRPAHPGVRLPTHRRRHGQVLSPGTLL